MSNGLLILIGMMVVALVAAGFVIVISSLEKINCNITLLENTLMAKIDDLTASLQTGLDGVAQSITDEIARVEALIAAGGLTDEQATALQAQIDRLTPLKAALDAERPAGS